MPDRRTFLAGLAALPLACLPAAGLAQSLSGDTVATAGGDLVIHPVGHATLVLAFGPHVIYADPAKMDFAGLPRPTGIVITHAHGDHFDPQTLERLAGTAPIVASAEVAGHMPPALGAQTTVLANGASGTINGLPISAIAAYNTTPERQTYHPKGVGNGYVLAFADKQIYIAGDTELTPEMAALRGIDVAFLPMNLPYTMSVAQAAEAVKAFRPKIVYPYHSRGSDIEKFKELVGDAAEVRLRDWYAGA